MYDYFNNTHEFSIFHLLRLLNKILKNERTYLCELDSMTMAHLSPC